MISNFHVAHLVESPGWRAPHRSCPQAEYPIEVIVDYTD